MGSVLVSLSLLLLLPIAIVDGGVGIPSTLDGPFKPVTVPLDKSFRGNAVDLPDTDPLVQRNVEGFEPEQISLSLSASHNSVWVSWITGTHHAFFFITSCFSTSNKRSQITVNSSSHFSFPPKDYIVLSLLQSLE